MKRKLFAAMSAFCLLLSGCQQQTTVKEPAVLRIAAAASLETVFENELIPLFEKENEGITVEGVYDSSGKLVMQMENGLQADVFMSAAVKQMEQLVEEGYVEEDAVVDLVENQLVLIKSTGSQSTVTGIEDILSAESIAIGDPDFVPAGEYARQALEALGIYDSVLEKASLGSNVTEVLAWVEAGSAEAGFVYATDAASSKKVEVIAPVDASLLEEQVIYPAAPLKNAVDPEAAQKFMEFLQGDAALEILENAGFVRV